jgi:type IV pilus assembly protein PilM
MLFKSSKLVGLDIGTSSIKLVEVERTKKSITLKNFGFIATPPGAISGGEVVSVELLAEAIRTLLEQKKIKTKRACTGIWGMAVITKKITIPRIEESLLREQLKWEAEQYIPFDINEISLEYQVLRQNQSNPENMNVLLVAAKRDLVLRYAEVVEMAGLECAIVDVSGFALHNCFEANYGQMPETVNALLNIGAGVTNFVVIDKGEVVFSRDIPVGGSSYTNDIHKALGISLEEAESLKLSAGTGQAVPQEVSDILRQTNETVVEELHRSFDFYAATAGDALIQRAFVTGGGLGVPGLLDAFKAVIQIPVETINPFLKIGYDRKTLSPDFVAQIAPYASVGIGLAMRQGAEK